MEFDYSQEAINKIAKIVTSQAGCSADFLLDREGLIEIDKKLRGRHKELKKKLGIKNRRQMKNRKYYRKHPKQGYNIDKQLFQELLELGLRIQEFSNILRELKY